MVVFEYEFTFVGHVFIGPGSGPMCLWAFGRARYARIGTKLYEVVQGPLLWWFLNTGSRSWVKSSLGLVRARCVVGPWLWPAMLGSTPCLRVCSRAILMVVCENEYTFSARVCIGPCSAQMCRWAFGRARSARIGTKLYEVVQGPLLWWFLNTGSRSWVKSSLGLVRARCVVGPWLGPDELGSTPCLRVCSRAILMVVCEHEYTFSARVCIGPCSAQMCRWAFGRARSARIGTKLYEVVQWPLPWWFLNTGSRSWVKSSLGLVRARCVVGPWLGPDELGSTPCFRRLFTGDCYGGS